MLLAQPWPKVRTHPPFGSCYCLATVVVAGEVDTIEFLEGRHIHEVVEVIKKRAIDSAVQAGADKGTCDF